ncbi:MAG: hypothetical protein RMK91_05675 [Pseudanabaenaceae cyanobacterium SKYGB_i_bin29]|nr:hypothetical protein [Pseudanabaenaceae cyanobacterium SKYG29]MDW8421339.1 hypothetical protein [Pseudanabaenaceae cyanobacterium SKYGB_i_bin29]
MRRRSYYYRSGTPTWRRILLLVLGGGFVLFLAVEILLRLVGGRFLTTNPSLAEYYQLRLATSQGEPIANSSNYGLKVKFSSPLPYTLVPNQSSPHWHINPQGMRDKEPLPQVKPANEFRIFLVGGSAAFGQYAPDNESTIGEILEQKLKERVKQQRQFPQNFQPPSLPFFAEQVEAALALPPRIPDREYRVINSAVPGYTSQEELTLLAHEILRLQPDYIIVLDGYADLLPPQPLSYQLDLWLRQPGLHFRQSLGYRLHRLWSQLAIVRLGKRLSTPPPIPQRHYKLAANWAERWQKYRFNLKQMGKLAAGKPLLVILQPEITGSGNRSDRQEQQILGQLDQTYQEVIQQSLGMLTPATLKMDLPGATVRNYYQIFRQFPQAAFVDPIHFTVAGNQYLAEQILNEVVRTIQLTPNAPPPNPSLAE